MERLVPVVGTLLDLVPLDGTLLDLDACQRPSKNSSVPKSGHVDRRPGTFCIAPPSKHK